MKKKTTQMIARYEAAVNEIATLFLNKQFGEDGEPPQEIDNSYNYWAGGEVGDTLCVGETWFYSFNDVLTDIKEDAPIGELDKYNEYCSRCIDLGLEPKINYHSWLHGAPRTPDSVLDHLEKMKRDFEEKIKEAKDGKEV